jgi:hypothetical protein
MSLELILTKCPKFSIDSTVRSWNKGNIKKHMDTSMLLKPIRSEINK